MRLPRDTTETPSWRSMRSRCSSRSPKSCASSELSSNCIGTRPSAPSALMPTPLRADRSSRPARLLARTAVIRTRAGAPMSRSGACGMHRLEIGAAADELARVAARLLEQHRQRAADAGGVEPALLVGDQRLQLGEALALDRLGHLLRQQRRRRARPRAVFEGEGLGEADLARRAPASPAKSRSLSPGKPTMKSDEKAMSGRAARSRSMMRR